MQIVLKIASMEIKNRALSFAPVILGTVAIAILYWVSEIKFALKDTYVCLLGQAFATLTSYQTISLYLMCD